MTKLEKLIAMGASEAQEEYMTWGKTGAEVFLLME